MWLAWLYLYWQPHTFNGLNIVSDGLTVSLLSTLVPLLIVQVHTVLDEFAPPHCRYPAIYLPNRLCLSGGSKSLDYQCYQCNFLLLTTSPTCLPPSLQIRCASFTSIFYLGCMLPLMAFKPFVDTTDDGQISSFHTVMTIIMWIGILPAAGVGALISHMRLQFFTETVAERFRCGYELSVSRMSGLLCLLQGERPSPKHVRLEFMQNIILNIIMAGIPSPVSRTAPVGTKSKFIYKFTDAREVEIIARCGRKWV